MNISKANQKTGATGVLNSLLLHPRCKQGQDKTGLSTFLPKPRYTISALSAYIYVQQITPS